MLFCIFEGEKIYRGSISESRKSLCQKSHFTQLEKEEKQDTLK